MDCWEASSYCERQSSLLQIHNPYILTLHPYVIIYLSFDLPANTFFLYIHVSVTSYCHLSSFFPLSTDSKRVLYLVAPGHHTGIWRYLVLCVLVWMVSGHTYRIVISIYRQETDFLGRWSQFCQVIKEKGIKCQNSDLNPDLYQIIYHTILLSFNFFLYKL